MLELVPPASNSGENLPEFLDYLFDGLEGYVATATKDLSKTDPTTGMPEFKRFSFAWPENKALLSDWILRESAERDVYVAPAIFSEASGKKESFKCTNVVWVEFDGTVPNTNTLGTIPAPTLRVRSSDEGHEHWYWKLETPLDNVSQVEGINRSLTYQLGADASGWDANQVLRPPGTHNYKRDLPVFVHSRGDGSVAPVLFDVLAPVEQVQVDVPEAIPDVTEVVLKYAWPKEAGDLYRLKDASNASVEGRSGALMKLAYFLAEMRMSDGEMFSVLRNADDRWGKFKDRTDRNRRLSDIIGKARLKYPLEIDLGEDLTPIYGLYSFLQTEIEISWIIPGLLQEQGYMLLVGPAGVGKTQYSLRWAINLALGRDFLGHEIAKGQRILFFSLEMGHADLKYFLSTMCNGMDESDLLLLEQNLLIVPLGEAWYLDQEKEQAKFEAIVADFNPDGIMVDSVGSSTSGNVSDESTVKKLMDFNDKIRQRHNVFTWFIHHQRKAQGDNKKPNKLDDVYGNQYLYNRATSVYLLWPQGSNIEVKPLKKRLAPMEDAWQISRQPNLDFKKGATVQLKSVDTLELEAEEAPGNGMLGI